MRRFILLFCLMLFAAVPAKARDTLDAGGLATLPVQHEGRVKPMDTVARATLKTFSGGDRIGGTSAIDWFAFTLFNPADALEQPVFRILKPDVAGLPVRDSRYYSFAEIAAALQTRQDIIARLQTIPEKDWSDDQRALMQIHAESLLYLQIVRSFSTLLPLTIAVPDSLRTEWKLPSGAITLRDIAPHKAQLREKIAAILKAKGEKMDRYTAEEQAIAAFAFETGILEKGGENNLFLRIIPTDGTWLSPWSALEQGKDDALLVLWQDVARAYAAGDQARFDAAAGKLRQSYTPTFRLTLENLYNNVHPLGSAILLYLTSFLAWTMSGGTKRNLPLKMSCAFLIMGAALHAFAIAGRIVILERPPVGTLYESILFVSLICVLAAAFIEWRRKDGIGTVIGVVCGIVMLFISQSFAGEDSMQVLVAVLNTNFWLATHVLCITIGYGVCVIAACLAHIDLFAQAYRRTGDTRLYGALRTTGLIALLFTTVGTILGGIWADQSWGRFWGWDPKENGALLIVLWLIWVYHGALSGHLRRLAFTACMAALNIVVALAWFGVNLLNVGLHSYGFISGVAASLAAFCLIESTVIGFLVWKAGQRKA